jgi:hypothetical protein
MSGPTLEEQIKGLERAKADLVAAKNDYTDPVAISDFNVYIAQVEAAILSLKKYQTLKASIANLIEEGMGG